MEQKGHQKLECTIRKSTEKGQAVGPGKITVDALKILTKTGKKMM